MGDVIDFEGKIAAACGVDRNEEFDAFLIREGLDLIAAFRLIGDPVVRKSISDMVQSIAMSGTGKKA